MGKTVRKLNTFMLYDFEYMQSWLEDLAGKGLLLSKAGQFIMCFETGEPVERKYQVAPYTGKMDKDDLRSFESRGWRRVPGQQLNIFFSDERDAIRPKRTLTNYKELRQDILFSMLLVVALNIMATGLLTLVDLDADTLESPMHILANVTYPVFVFSLTFLTFAVVTSSVAIIKSLKFFNRVNQSALIRENLDHKRKRLVGCIGRFAALLIIIAMIYAVVSSMGEYETEENVNRGTVSNSIGAAVNPRLLTFDKIYPEKWDELKKKEAETKKGKEEYHYAYRESIGPFFDVYLQIFYTKELIYCSSKLVLANSENSAKKYFKEELDGVIYEKKSSRRILKVPGIEYACTGKTELKENYVAAWNKNAIIMIKCSDKKILDKNHVGLIMKMFRKIYAE